MEDYSNSILSTLDWKSLADNIVANEYSYYTIETVNKILSNIIENDSMPNIEKLRIWFPIFRLHKRGHNSVVYKISRYDKPFLVLKSLLGCTYDQKLNDLRKECVFFPYTYSIIEAGTIIDDGDISLAMFPSTTEKSTYVFTELINYEYTLDTFLRFQECSLVEYLTLYAQVIKAMDLAQKYDYINGNLTTSNILVSHKYETPIAIPFGKEHITTNRILRISNCDKREGHVCDDLYRFTSSFLYNLLCLRQTTNASKQMVNILIDLMLELKIPIYYINKINRLTKLENETMTEDLRYIQYTDALKFLSPHLKDILVVGEVSLDTKFEVNYSVSQEEGILHLFYSGKGFGLEVAWWNSFVDKMKEIKEAVDDSFKQVDALSNIKSYNIRLLINLPEQSVSNYYNTIINYFETLLYIKLLLDDLKQRLTYLEDLREHLINDITHNYIIENNAKLSRKAAEYIAIYDNALLVMNKVDITKIKAIWNILNLKESLK